MSNSYKPKNSNYIDSTGIVHDRTILSTLLTTLTNNLFKKEVGLSGTDLDDLWSRGSGFFDVRNVSANSPVIRSTNNHWHIIQYNGYNLEYGIQIAVYFFAALPNIYVRKMSGGSWGDWYSYTGTVVS